MVIGRPAESVVVYTVVKVEVIGATVVPGASVVLELLSSLPPPPLVDVGVGDEFEVGLLLVVGPAEVVCSLVVLGVLVGVGVVLSVELGVVVGSGVLLGEVVDESGSSVDDAGASVLDDAAAAVSDGVASMLPVKIEIGLSCLLPSS